MFANGAIAYRLIRHSFIWSALVTRGEFPPPLFCCCFDCVSLLFVCPVAFPHRTPIIYWCIVLCICSHGLFRFWLSSFCITPIHHGYYNIFSVQSNHFAGKNNLFYPHWHPFHTFIHVCNFVSLANTCVCVCVRVLGLSMPSHSYQFCYGFATLRHTLYYMAFMTFAS